MLDQIKLLLRDQLGIPPIIILAIGGCVLHVAFSVFIKRPITSPFGLLAPLFAGVALETYEIWSHYHVPGLFAAGNDPLLIIVARHSVDVLAMLALPLVLVLIGLSGAR